MKGKIEIHPKVDAEIYLVLHKEDGTVVRILSDEFWWCDTEIETGKTKVTYRNANEEFISVYTKETKKEIYSLIEESNKTYGDLENQYSIIPRDKRLEYEEELEKREITLTKDTVKDLDGKCYFDFDMAPERLEIFKFEVTDSEIIQHCAWCTSMNGDLLEFSDEFSEDPVKVKDTYLGTEILMIRDPNDIFLKEIPEELYEEILGKIKMFLEAFDKQDKWFDSIRDPLIKKLETI